MTSSNTQGREMKNHTQACLALQAKFEREEGSKLVYCDCPNTSIPALPSDVKGLRPCPRVLSHAPSPPQEDVSGLVEALHEMVYETTHLSPCEDDGSHRCRITGPTLAKARAALASTPKASGRK